MADWLLDLLWRRLKGIFARGWILGLWWRTYFSVVGWSRSWSYCGGGVHQSFPGYYNSTCFRGGCMTTFPGRVKIADGPVVMSAKWNSSHWLAEMAAGPVMQGAGVFCSQVLPELAAGPQHEYILPAKEPALSPTAWHDFGDNHSLFFLLVFLADGFTATDSISWQSSLYFDLI